MKVDAGSGSEGGTGAYRKFSTSPAPHTGTVYAVAGSSGSIGGGTLDHPAMFVSLNVMGSLVLDVNDGRLDVQFVDDHSAVRDSFTILKDPIAPLVITTASLPNGGTGAPYQQALGATGGRQPYTWSTLAGSLPASLTLNPATGLISGTPATPGTSVFTVRVSDSAVPSVTADRQLSIAIAAAEATVPNVINLTEAAAVAAITNAALTRGTVANSAHASVPIGSVISQDPAGGSQAPIGAPVNLVVSNGVTVPQAVGLSQSAATALISGVAGLSVGAITTASSPTIAAGLVMSQNPTANTNVSGGTAVALLVSSGAPQVVVPNVVEMTQAAATAAITAAGLTQGTISSAASASVPIGRVIGQSPAAGSQVAAATPVALVISTGITRPVVIGSLIAGTFVDASGHSGQSHLFYAANAGVWWLLTLTSSADSPGGTNHLIKAYRSSGPDLASATWTAAASSPGAAAAGSVNCGSCSMGGGRSLGVAYINNAPTDAVHAEVAMAFNGQNGLTAHIRATVTATTISWATWSYYDAPAATWTMPRGNALGVSTGKTIHSGGPILQQEVDANVRVSTNPDLGAAWTSGFSAVSLIDNSMFHESNSMTFAALASNRMLSVYDNGGGQAPCFLCGGGVSEPSLSNLGYRRSNIDGSWPTLPVGGQAAGDGNVFSTDATIDHNDWALVSRDTTSIYAFRRNAAGNGLDAAAYNAAANTWGAFPSPPLFGSGQSHKPASGVFGASTASGILLFVISNDSSNSILYTKYEAAAWSAWATVPGTDTGAHVRSFISGYPIAAAGQVGVIWTEGTTQFDVVATSIPLASTVPDVLGMTQAVAATRITGAGLSVGSVTFASSATVAAGSVISQSPAAGSSLPPGAAVDLVIALATIPDVLTLTQAAAAAAITNAGLTLGSIGAASSATVPIGSVVSQSPPALTQVAAGTPVDLVVSSGIAVPDVVGQTQSAAQALISSTAGLAAGTITSAVSDSVAAGLVIGQNPAAGTNVSSGTPIDIVVSSGPPTVPGVVGLTQAAATASITAAQLEVGTVTNEASATVAVGLVISQSPIAGSPVTFGSAVNLAISLGPAPVPAPDVVNTAQAVATSLITGAGLTVGIITQASSATVPAGSVISQDPTAGTLVPANGAVNLLVSTGRPPVTLPNVVNLTLAAATTALQSAGLAVGTTTSASSTTVPSGSVTSQNPAAGTQVAFGSAVNLVVSTGPPPVVVPSVVNLTQSAASSAITGAGLAVGTITSSSSATVPAGSVISQNPASGTQVAFGSAVSLVVSSGPPPPSPIVDQVVFSDGNSTRTTPSFSTTAANELLLAFVGSDGPAAANSQTVTVTGAGLAWTLVRRANTQAGTSEVWQAKAIARLTNVTVKSTQSMTGFRQSLTVVTFRGASGIGASAAANAATGAPSVTLATTKANALVYGVGTDWDRAVARTLGSSQVMVHQSVVTAVGATFWVQRRNAAVPSAGTSVEINCTAPTNDRWNLVGVEIVP
jgi:beta-lactam-binding protein with PASTA domain